MPMRASVPHLGQLETLKVQAQDCPMLEWVALLRLLAASG